MGGSELSGDGLLGDEILCVKLSTCAYTYSSMTAWSPSWTAELDRRAGPRRRSAFIMALICQCLDDERRWDEIEATLGALDDHGHPWDADPGEWVRQQRRTDERRSG